MLVIIWDENDISTFKRLNEKKKKIIKQEIQVTIFDIIRRMEWAGWWLGNGGENCFSV